MHLAGRFKRWLQHGAAAPVQHAAAGQVSVQAVAGTLPGDVGQPARLQAERCDGCAGRPGAGEVGEDKAGLRHVELAQQRCLRAPAGLTARAGKALREFSQVQGAIGLAH